jgi:hypothetical protein
MRFGGLLKTKGGFAPVAAVGVTARQERQLGDPHAIFILPNLHFRKRNDHIKNKLTCSKSDVKDDGRQQSALLFCCIPLVLWHTVDAINE